MIQFIYFIDLIRVGEVVCNSGDELERLGSSISRCVDIGDVLLLYGNLGLGKVCIYFFILRALSVCYILFFKNLSVDSTF